MEKKLLRILFAFCVLLNAILNQEALLNNSNSIKEANSNISLSDFELNFNAETHLNLFAKYCKKFQKAYCSFDLSVPIGEFSAEFSLRFNIFSENIKRLTAHNSNPNRFFDVQLTQFTDMTKDEVAQRLLDFNLQRIPELKFLNDVHNHKSVSEISLSNNLNNYNNNYNNNYLTNSVWPTIDWRTKNILNPVRNQGECGGCWAFSVAGTIESLLNIRSGSINPYLSVQQLIDCDSSDKGCKGGWAPNALKYVSRNGLVWDSDYPYAEKNEACKADLVSDPSNIQARIDPSYLRCDEDECKQGEFNYNLLKDGPVAVVIDAYNTNFYNYKSGFYNEQCAEPNHAVVLVGFGFDSAKNVKYWIIRNSWGSDWGMNGYGYVKYDEQNYWSCNLGRYGFQPKILN